MNIRNNINMNFNNTIDINLNMNFNNTIDINLNTNFNMNIRINMNLIRINMNMNNTSFRGRSTICKFTFFEHRHNHLSPAVREVWSKEQKLQSDEMKADAPLAVGGDGRPDTPGHSAKYGPYSLMDLDNKIITMELVQSTEVKSSVHMEKEGLIGCVRNLEEYDVFIGKIITDRHVQITNWLREMSGLKSLYILQ
nr:uncharacterized protein LOC113818472 [Penaeus vannamei]